jgi:hypothetical protein
MRYDERESYITTSPRINGSRVDIQTSYVETTTASDTALSKKGSSPVACFHHDCVSGRRKSNGNLMIIAAK